MMRFILIMFFAFGVFPIKADNGKLSIDAQKRLLSEIEYFMNESESLHPFIPIPEYGIRFEYFLRINKWDVSNNTFDYCFGYSIGKEVFKSMKQPTFVILSDNKKIYVSISEEINKKELYVNGGVFKEFSLSDWKNLLQQDRSKKGILFSGKMFHYFVNESNDLKTITRYNYIYEVPKNLRNKTFFSDKVLAELSLHEKEAGDKE